MNYFPVGGSIGKLPCVYNGVEKKIKGVRIEKAPFFEDSNKRPSKWKNIYLDSYSYSFRHNNETYAQIYGTIGSSYHTALMKLDVDRWIEVNVGVNFNRAVSYDGKIHLLTFGSSPKHYMLDGEILTELTPPPSTYSGMSVGSFAGKLHIFGGYSSSYYSDATHYYSWTVHYEWDGEKWTSATQLPGSVYNASVVVTDDSLYLLGGKYYNSGDTHSSDAGRCYILNTDGTWTVGNPTYGLIHTDGDGSHKLGFVFDDTVMIWGRGRVDTPSNGYYTDFYSLTPNGWVLTYRLYRTNVNFYNGLVVAEDDCIKIFHEKTPAIFVDNAWNELYSNQDFVAIPIFN